MQFFVSGTTTPVSFSAVNLLTDIDGISTTVGTPGLITDSGGEHVSWKTSQVAEAQYSSDTALTRLDPAFTGVPSAAAAVTSGYDKMAVGQYGNSLGSSTANGGNGGNDTYPDSTAKAVRLVSYAVSQFDWGYYGGQFGRITMDFTGATSLVANCPDLQLVKTGAAFATPASPLTYTLTVNNLTSSVAASTVVTDTLPTGVAFVSASNSGVYSAAANTVTWNLGTVAANATQALTVTVTTPASAAVSAGNKTLTNTAKVASPNDTNSANNTGTATTALILGNLTKTVQNVKTGGTVGTTGTGLPGDVLEYCIGFQNQGGVDLPAFQITDSVPTNVTALTTGGAAVNGYDTAANSSGFTGSGYGVKLTRGAVTSYLSSVSDADSGSLTASGGTYGQGLMSVNLGTLTIGESGTACFRATIN
ncbi:DUF11 domain-containing protein [Deinococcus ruber]|uniref:DUF11 domain-containing protein n=1 Tax=Deinococcus ruber TaxID=1848197 RepID=A0A918CC26_9DEIO|nr:DUF11 domain-containing protein [Deinococcus ruber]GGR15081.1 hypothetical protein GCM10008957_29960 [Deinococcus ruber]